MASFEYALIRETQSISLNNVENDDSYPTSGGDQCWASSSIIWPDRRMPACCLQNCCSVMAMHIQAMQQILQLDHVEIFSKNPSFNDSAWMPFVRFDSIVYANSSLHEPCRVLSGSDNHYYLSATDIILLPMQLLCSYC